MIIEKNMDDVAFKIYKSLVWSYLEISITWPMENDNKLLTNSEFLLENTRLELYITQITHHTECIATKTRQTLDKIVKERNECS